MENYNIQSLKGAKVNKKMLPAWAIFASLFFVIGTSVNAMASEAGQALEKAAETRTATLEVTQKL